MGITLKTPFKNQKRAAKMRAGGSARKETEVNDKLNQSMTQCFERKLLINANFQLHVINSPLRSLLIQCFVHVELQFSPIQVPVSLIKHGCKNTSVLFCVAIVFSKKLETTILPKFTELLCKHTEHD